MARALKAVAATARAASAVDFFSRLQTLTPTVRAISTSQSAREMADPVWKLGRLNHVAIAVPDLEKATAFYKNILGAQVSEPVPLPEHGVSVVFVNLGNTKMELLHPLGSDSPIAGFLQKNKAGGMHHVCIESYRQRQRQRVRSSIHWFTPDGCNSRSYADPKPGARRFLRVSHAGG
ncbi:methylmalonyl-CoA epimerase, mitochondrial isoform X2 [Lepus europaeus]|uniref:methylmalonyl-CoA epimerase, mitochondrial isoform X2 n=1 Tax=Lepus europaeus TaxID=9983 RepID=UPI002B479A15|nr:methylmalonyl-CoA epimerase, mitochondrial isoform X2 [Lepus europaeus]